MPICVMCTFHRTSWLVTPKCYVHELGVVQGLWDELHFVEFRARVWVSSITVVLVGRMPVMVSIIGVVGHGVVGTAACWARFREEGEGTPPSSMDHPLVPPTCTSIRRWVEWGGDFQFTPPPQYTATL